MKKIETKKLKRKVYLNQTGITLIALVVTIVVLLILAGVSVNALFGNSGIIEKAKEAQNAMDKAKENDEKGINELTNWINNQVNENNDAGNQTVKIISFTVNGDAYQAKEGMTWGEWIASEYNTDGFKYEDDCIWNSKGYGSIIDLNAVITAIEYRFRELSQV